MKKSLFDYLLEKKKLKKITSVEEKILKFYLQIDVLKHYFDIVTNYCKADKIQKEAEDLCPCWTGYENYYWYAYHYESFGNAIYSYTEAYKSILNFLKRKISDFPQIGEIYLNKFISDSAIEKILTDRGDFVHQFGEWRSEISNELKIQDWKSAETKIVSTIIKAHKQLKIFDSKMIKLINNKIQSDSENANNKLTS